MSEPKIVRAVIIFLETEQDMAAVFTSIGGRAVVTATFGDGLESEVLRYYANELTFTAEEFVGLTQQKVSDLFTEKDIASLQSQRWSRPVSGPFFCRRGGREALTLPRTTY